MRAVARSLWIMRHSVKQMPTLAAPEWALCISKDLLGFTLRHLRVRAEAPCLPGRAADLLQSCDRTGPRRRGRARRRPARAAARPRPRVRRLRPAFAKRESRPRA